MRGRLGPQLRRDRDGSIAASRAGRRDVAERSGQFRRTYPSRRVASASRRGAPDARLSRLSLRRALSLPKETVSYITYSLVYLSDLLLHAHPHPFLLRASSTRREKGEAEIIFGETPLK